jgi:hypothetical protein
MTLRLYTDQKPSKVWTCSGQKAHNLCEAQRYLTLIDCGLVYTATFQPMGEILRLERHWHIAEISVHYHNIGGGVGGGTASTVYY